MEDKMNKLYKIIIILLSLIVFEGCIHKDLKRVFVDEMLEKNINVNSVKKLLESGVDPDLFLDSSVIGYKYKSITDTTALMLAIESNNLDVVKLLVKYGANVNYIDEDNDSISPLILAIYLGHDDISKYLLTRNVDISYYDDTGMTALMTAIRWKRLSMIKELLIHGADPNQKTYLNMNAFSICDEYQCNECKKILLDFGKRYGN